MQTVKRLLDLDEPEIGLLNYPASPHRNRKHLQCVPNVLPSRPNDEPDSKDIQDEDLGEVLPPDDPGDEVVPSDDPGDAVVPPVDVPAGLSKPAVYTRCGRAVRRPVTFE